MNKLGGEIRQAIGSDIPLLWFLCPECDGGHYHMVPFHSGEPFEHDALGKVWTQTGGTMEPGTLTLAPSYNSECLHCFIKEGSVEVL